MEPDFSFLFHQSSKSLLKGHPPIPLDSREWPVEWKTVYYKAYQRLPKIALEQGSFVRADFFETLQKRESKTDFGPQGITLSEISQLLQYSCGNMRVASDGSSMRRAQPSGGARYPIEVYPLVLKGEGKVKPGLYHYNVKMHALDVLWEKEFSSEELEKLFVYDWAKKASCIFLMTAVFHRNQMKYGERGYRYILLEAGHIGQGLCLIAPALNLKCSPLGGTYDEAVEGLLDIDGVVESTVYAVAVGK